MTMRKGGWNSKPTASRPSDPPPQPQSSPAVSMPECDKMCEARPYSQKIGEFLDWLAVEKNWCICEPTYRNVEPYMPVCFNMEELLAEFFEISLAKIEKERRELLERLRETK